MTFFMQRILIVPHSVYRKIWKKLLYLDAAINTLKSKNNNTLEGRWYTNRIIAV